MRVLFARWMLTQALILWLCQWDWCTLRSHSQQAQTKKAILGTSVRIRFSPFSTLNLLPSTSSQPRIKLANRKTLGLKVSQMAAGKRKWAVGDQTWWRETSKECNLCSETLKAPQLCIAQLLNKLRSLGRSAGLLPLESWEKPLQSLKKPALELSAKKKAKNKNNLWTWQTVRKTLALVVSSCLTLILRNLAVQDQLPLKTNHLLIQLNKSGTRVKQNVRRGIQRRRLETRRIVNWTRPTWTRTDYRVSQVSDRLEVMKQISFCCTLV